MMQIMEGERGIVLNGFKSDGEIVNLSSSGIQVEEQEKTITDFGLEWKNKLDSYMEDQGKEVDGFTEDLWDLQNWDLIETYSENFQIMELLKDTFTFLMKYKYN